MGKELQFGKPNVVGKGVTVWGAECSGKELQFGKPSVVGRSYSLGSRM